MQVTSGRRLGNQPCGRASHGCCPFPAVLERLLPVQPLHLLTFRNRPALFRHLSSRPPVLRQALGPLPAGTRGTHSFNDGGVCWATSGANSARGAGWGLRSAVPSGVRSRAASRAGSPGPAVQARPDSKGPPPACRNRFPNRPASPASGCPALAGSASRVGDPAGTELSAWAPRRLGIWGGRSSPGRNGRSQRFDLEAWHRSPRRPDPRRREPRGRRSQAETRPLGSLGASLSLM